MARPKKTSPKEAMSDRVAAFNLLKTQFGDLGREFDARPIDRDLCLPTPSTQFNIITNDGGVRPGTCVEFYGEEGASKTGVALQMARQAQKKYPDKSVAYIDTESAVDKWVAVNKFGIDVGFFDDGMPKFVFWPDPEYDPVPSLEQVMDRIYKYAASGQFSFIVLDSYAATPTRIELEGGEAADAQYGGGSKIMRSSLSKIIPVMVRTGTNLWIINQMTTHMVTGSLKPKGGQGVKYSAYMRVHAKWKDKEEGNSVGLLQIKMDKTRYGPPYRTAIIPIRLGEGIDENADLILAATDAGIVKKSGSWYSYKETQIGQGLPKAADYIAEHEEMKKEILEATMEKSLPKIASTEKE